MRSSLRVLVVVADDGLDVNDAGRVDELTQILIPDVAELAVQRGSDAAVDDAGVSFVLLLRMRDRSQIQRPSLV